MFVSVRVPIECYWLACTGRHLAGNCHLIGCMQWGLSLGYLKCGRFTGLKIHSFKVFMEAFLHCLGQKWLLFSIIKERRLYSRKNFRGSSENVKTAKD